MKTIGTIALVIAFIWVVLYYGPSMKAWANKCDALGPSCLPSLTNNNAPTINIQIADLGRKLGKFDYHVGTSQMLVAYGFTDETGTCSVRHWGPGEDANILRIPDTRSQYQPSRLSQRS
jgi:hypothetical protein